MGRKHGRPALWRLLELIVQYAEERLREKSGAVGSFEELLKLDPKQVKSIKVLKEPGPGPEMASPEEVNEVLARAHRILAKQRLLEMPTISKRIH